MNLGYGYCGACHDYTSPPYGRRYTLEEAADELNRRQCVRYGHDYEHVTHGTVGLGAAGENLVAVYCGRCGVRWKVTPT